MGTSGSGAATMSAHGFANAAKWSAVGAPSGSVDEIPVEERDRAITGARTGAAISTGSAGVVGSTGSGEGAEGELSAAA